MTRIRVLELIQGFAVEGPLGGIERFGIELMRALDRDQVAPILCGLWRYHTPFEEQRVTELREEGIEAFFAADWDESHPYRSFFEAWRGVRLYLANQRVHLIHSHCQFGDGIALLTAPTLRAGAILRTVHNEREWIKRPGRRLLLTNLLFPATFRLEIGVSQQVARNLEQRPFARLLRRHSRCVYNAIDLERFASPAGPHVREQKRRELGLPLDAFVVGSVGRLAVQKGYSILLEAAARVLSEQAFVRFVIVGDGELAEELHKQAGQLGIGAEVCFTGARQDVEDLLPAMDLFASSSLWEGLPTVILESMAARIPVVATDVSGTRELVRDAETGLLVPPGDPEALADAIQRVVRREADLATMIERAYGRAQEFSIAQVAEQHLEIYQTLAKCI